MNHTMSWASRTDSILKRAILTTVLRSAFLRKIKFPGLQHVFSRAIIFFNMRKLFYLFIILTWGYFFIAVRERRKRGWGERQTDRQTSMWARHRSFASCTRPCWGSNHNLGVCPDWEPNPCPSGAWDGAINWSTLGRGNVREFLI